MLETAAQVSQIITAVGVAILLWEVWETRKIRKENDG